MFIFFLWLLFYRSNYNWPLIINSSMFDLPLYFHGKAIVIYCRWCGNWQKVSLKVSILWAVIARSFLIDSGMFSAVNRRSEIWASSVLLRSTCSRVQRAVTLCLAFETEKSSVGRWKFALNPTTELHNYLRGFVWKPTGKIVENIGAVIAGWKRNCTQRSCASKSFLGVSLAFLLQCNPLHCPVE